MAKLSRFIGLTLVAFLVIAIAIAGCAPKVSGEKVVKIGNRVTVTGAIASAAIWHAYGNFDYVNELNERGGLDGVLVDHIWEDTAGQGTRAITAHRRFVEKGVVVELETISTGAELTALKQQKDGVPLWWLGQLTAGMITPGERWVFSVAPSYAGSVATLMKWVKDEMWQEARLPRWGMILYDHASGWDAYKGLEVGAEMGFGENVGREVVPLLGTIDTSVEWLRLAGKNPDWVFIHAYGATEVTLIKDASRLEIRDAGINLVNTYVSITEPIIGIVGPGDAEGWYGYSSAAVNTQTDIPDLMAVLELAKKYRDWAPEDVPANYLLVYHSTGVVLEGVRRAIEKVGLENVTGRDVRDALATLEGYEKAGIAAGLAPPAKISERRPYAVNGWTFNQIRGGRIYPVSDSVECVYHPPELED